ELRGVRRSGGPRALPAAREGVRLKRRARRRRPGTRDQRNNTHWRESMKSKATAAAVAAFTTLALTARLATAEAQTPTRWRMHTAYHEALPVAAQTAFRVAESVKEMSDGKFDIRVFEPGAIVAGAQYYDAVSKGAVNAAYGSPGFNAGKNSAYSFFAAIPFGPGEIGRAHV